MDTLKTDAESFKIGLIAGVYEVSDVIRWADSEIVRLDKPPLVLIDLAMMSKARGVEVINQLDLIPGEVDKTQAIQKFLGQMYFVLMEDSSKGFEFARGLYRLYVELDYKVAENFHFMAFMDDSYESAIHKIWGTEEEVYEEFLEFLKPFAEMSGQSSLPQRNFL
jgi:hypothetical protein